MSLLRRAPKAAPAAPDTVPFDGDRAQSEVIRFVVQALAGLAYILYVLVGTLLVIATSRGAEVTSAVPGELWAAAAAATGVLGGLLVGTRSGGQGDKTTVNAEAGSTVVAGTPADDLLDDPVALDADKDTGAGDVRPDSPAAIQSDADDPDTPAVDPNGNDLSRL